MCYFWQHNHPSVTRYGCFHTEMWQKKKKKKIFIGGYARRVAALEVF